MDEENVNQDVIQEEVTQEQDSSDSQENLDNQDVVTTPDEEQELQEDTEEDAGEPAELSPRQQKRVEQLEKKAEELKLTKILDRIQQTKQPVQRDERQPMDYREAIDAPDEVYNSLDQDRRNYGDQRYNEGLEKSKAIEFKMNIKLDLPLVKDKLDRLDPADATALDREYLQLVGFDPNTGYVQNSDIGYADFIDARIQQAERLAASMALKSQKNIAKQAAQTGIRPDGGAHKGLQISSPQDIANMSSEDFEKNKAAIYKAAGLKL